MGFFRQPKPRAFHHEFIYADDHKERVRKAKQNILNPESADPYTAGREDKVHEYFKIERNKRLERRKQLPFISGLNTVSLLMLIAIVTILLFILFK